MVQAIVAVKLSSLTSTDHQAFLMLLRQTFPSVATTGMPENAQLDTALLLAAEEHKLCLSDEQKEKIRQLEMSLQQRMGVIVVGPPRSGKSTLWRILKDAKASLDRFSFFCEN